MSIAEAQYSWADVEQAFAWHEAPDAAASILHYFTHLAHLYVPTEPSAANTAVTLEHWGHARLQCLHTYMREIQSPYMQTDALPRDAERPIIIYRGSPSIGARRDVLIDGARRDVLIDGARRVNYWLSQPDRPRPVLVIERIGEVRPLVAINIISPGPSLFAAYRPNGLPVIAVNRAAEHYPSDWWCCGDYAEQGTPKHTPPAIVTLRREGVIEADPNQRVIYFDQLEHQRRATCNLPDRAFAYSATAALVLAFCLQAEVIHAYGCDMRGERYCDGHSGPDLSDARWRTERQIWEAVVHWLNRHGVPVIRHQPPAPPAPLAPADQAQEATT